MTLIFIILYYTMQLTSLAPPSLFLEVEEDFLAQPSASETPLAKAHTPQANETPSQPKLELNPQPFTPQRLETIPEDQRPEAPSTKAHTPQANETPLQPKLELNPQPFTPQRLETIPEVDSQPEESKTHEEEEKDIQLLKQQNQKLQLLRAKVNQKYPFKVHAAIQELLTHPYLLNMIIKEFALQANDDNETKENGQYQLTSIQQDLLTLHDLPQILGSRRLAGHLRIILQQWKTDLHFLQQLSFILNQINHIWETTSNPLKSLSRLIVTTTVLHRYHHPVTALAPRKHNSKDTTTPQPNALRSFLVSIDIEKLYQEEHSTTTVEFATNSKALWNSMVHDTEYQDIQDLESLWQQVWLEWEPWEETESLILEQYLYILKTLAHITSQYPIEKSEANEQALIRIHQWIAVQSEILESILQQMAASSTDETAMSLSIDAKELWQEVASEPDHPKPPLSSAAELFYQKLQQTPPQDYIEVLKSEIFPLIKDNEVLWENPPQELTPEQIKTVQTVSQMIFLAQHATTLYYKDNNPEIYTQSMTLLIEYKWYLEGNKGLSSQGQSLIYNILAVFPLEDTEVRIGISYITEMLVSTRNLSKFSEQELKEQEFILRTFLHFPIITEPTFQELYDYVPLMADPNETPLLPRNLQDEPKFELYKRVPVSQSSIAQSGLKMFQLSLPQYRPSTPTDSSDNEDQNPTYSSQTFNTQPYLTKLAHQAEKEPDLYALEYAAAAYLDTEKELLCDEAERYCTLLLQNKFTLEEGMRLLKKYANDTVILKQFRWITTFYKVIMVSRGTPSQTQNNLVDFDKECIQLIHNPPLKKPKSIPMSQDKSLAIRVQNAFGDQLQPYLLSIAEQCDQLHFHNSAPDTSSPIPVTRHDIHVLITSWIQKNQASVTYLKQMDFLLYTITLLYPSSPLSTTSLLNQVRQQQQMLRIKVSPQLTIDPLTNSFIKSINKYLMLEDSLTAPQLKYEWNQWLDQIFTALDSLGSGGAQERVLIEMYEYFKVAAPKSSKMKKHVLEKISEERARLYASQYPYPFLKSTQTGSESESKSESESESESESQLSSDLGPTDFYTKELNRVSKELQEVQKEVQKKLTEKVIQEVPPSVLEQTQRVLTVYLKNILHPPTELEVSPLPMEDLFILLEQTELMVEEVMTIPKLQIVCKTLITKVKLQGQKQIQGQEVEQITQFNAMLVGTKIAHQAPLSETQKKAWKDQIDQTKVEVLEHLQKSFSHQYLPKVDIQIEIAPRVTQEDGQLAQTSCAYNQVHTSSSAIIFIDERLYHALQSTQLHPQEKHHLIQMILENEIRQILLKKVLNAELTEEQLNQIEMVSWAQTILNSHGGDVTENTMLFLEFLTQINTPSGNVSESEMKFFTTMEEWIKNLHQHIDPTTLTNQLQLSQAFKIVTEQTPKNVNLETFMQSTVHVLRSA